ncbi:MAG: HAD family hydrolase [Proteobacteria bacterium]|nr:HAD family hydrolase [Pseudomonadota bacterium]
MIRGVLIDLDDTLVDHRDAHRAALAGVRDRHPALQAVPFEALLDESRRVLVDLHHDVQLGRLAPDAARVERYRRLFAFAGAHCDTPHAAAATLGRELYQSLRGAVPGARELLVALRERVPVAIVTNNVTVEQEEKLARFALAAHVDALVTSEDVGVAKPDPRIFDAALARLRIARDEAVMLGDSREHDVEGARAAGIAAAWLDRAGEACGDEPFVVFRSLEPTADVVARLLAH